MGRDFLKIRKRPNLSRPYPGDDPDYANPAEPGNGHKYTHAWTSKFNAVTRIKAYCIQKYLDEVKTDKIVVKDEYRVELSIDYEKNSTVSLNTMIVYGVDGQLIEYSCSNGTNTITSNYSLEKVAAEIEEYIKTQNPLIGKNHILAYDDDGEEQVIMKKPRQTRISDVILDPQLKDDIIDNSIYHLENMEENNGIIIEGPPGTGKTLITNAVICEANKKGYSSLVITTKPNFSLLEEVLNDLLGPSIVVFEDIDSFGQNRNDTVNTGLSEFLQFINGVSEQDNSTIFIATTNFLDQLDDAIKKRPARFNRIFKVDFPARPELVQLVALYFGEEIAEKYKSTYIDKRLAGSHIKELKRTCSMLCKKRSVTVDDIFLEAFDLVAENFSITLQKGVGF